MRLWPTESMRAKTLCAEAIVASSRWLISRSAAAQASSLGLAHDDVQADAEAERAPVLARAAAFTVRDLLGDLRRRLAPGQVLVDRLGRDIDPGLRRAAEIERRIRLLHRLEEQLAVLDADVLAANSDGLAGEERP